MLFPWDVSHIILWCKILAQVGISGCRNWDWDSCVSASLRECSQGKGNEGSRVEQEKEVSKEAVSAEDLLQSDPTGTMKHDLYHGGGLTLRRRAGLLYFISVSHWLWVCPWGVGCRGVTSLRPLQVGWGEVSKEGSSCEPLADNTSWWVHCPVTGILAVNQQCLQ